MIIHCAIFTANFINLIKLSPRWRFACVSISSFYGLRDERYERLTNQKKSSSNAMQLGVKMATPRCFFVNIVRILCCIAFRMRFENLAAVRHN